MYIYILVWSIDTTVQKWWAVYPTWQLVGVDFVIRLYICSTWWICLNILFIQIEETLICWLCIYNIDRLLNHKNKLIKD